MSTIKTEQMDPKDALIHELKEYHADKSRVS